MVETIKKIENVYWLQIGVQGENIANVIQMDMSSWIEQFPDAHIHILFKPYNDSTPSPVASELNGAILSWYPSYAATSVPGVGYTEVRAINAQTGLVKKSRIIPTSVENSVSGTDGTTIPSPFQEWVNQVLAIKDDAVEAAEIARAGRDAALKINGLTAGGHTVDYGAGADAALSERDGHYHLEISAERGAPGENGRDAAVITLGPAQYAFHLENGHLILEYGDDGIPSFSIDEQGHLIMEYAGDIPAPQPGGGGMGAAIFGTAVFG